MREPHAGNDLLGGDAAMGLEDRAPQVELPGRGWCKARVAAFARNDDVATVIGHEIGDAQPRAHAHHHARFARRGLARLHGREVTGPQQVEPARGRREVVHHAHPGNEEAALDRVAIDRERAMRHLHLVALRGTGDAEARRGDALALLAHAVPFAEESGEHRGKTPGVRRHVAPRERRLPLAAARFADFQQNLGRAHVTRQYQTCLPRKTTTRISREYSSPPPNAPRW